MIDKNKIILRENQGFTLVEILISVSILGAVSIGIMNYKGIFDKEIKRIEVKSETLVGVGLANKIMGQDLLMSSPSFTFIDRIANKIPCKKDYENENSEDSNLGEVQFWSQNLTTECYGSEVVLNQDGDTFSFIITDKTNPEMTFFLPHVAYSYQNKLGSELEFDKKKFINFLGSDDANIWKANSFFKIEANSNIEDATYDDSPMEYSLLFKSTPNNIDDYFDDYIPQIVFKDCKGGASYEGIDLFFRCMPLDGSDFRIKAHGVRYVGYKLVKMKNNYEGFTLFKELKMVKSGKVVTISKNLVSYIKYVSFKRKDMSSNIISFDIKYTPRKKEDK